ATALLERDPAAARAALVAYATGLGRLHACTAGREAQLNALKQEMSVQFAYAHHTRDHRDEVDFRRLCELVGVTVDAAFDDDVQQVEKLLAAPGPFRVLTHGDPCPDNECMTENGAALFFDFEAS